MKGLIRSLRNAAPSRQAVVKRNIPIRNLPLSFTGASGVGFASAVLGDFPEGNILFLGAVAYIGLKKASSGASSVQDTFDGDYSVGTTPTADATLSTTDANLIPSTSFGGAATGGVGLTARGASSTNGVIFDNTDGSLELNLNAIIDDANISGDTQAMLANGYVSIVFSVLGDD